MILDYTILSFTTAFFLGFLGNLHCLGMCGGIITILSLSLEKKKKIYFYYICYNIGRIVGYIFVMLYAFILGFFLINVFNFDFSKYLRYFSGFFLIYLGLYLLGFFNFFSFIEKISYSIWRYFKPYIKNFLPVRNYFHACFLGVIWGHIPCGLVYSALLWALTSNSLFKSILLIIFFGLGTLPAVLTASFFISHLKVFLSNFYFKLLSSIILCVLGFFDLFYNFFFIL